MITGAVPHLGADPPDFAIWAGRTPDPGLCAPRYECAPSYERASAVSPGRKPPKPRPKAGGAQAEGEAARARSSCRGARRERAWASRARRPPGGPGRCGVARAAARDPHPARGAKGLGGEQVEGRQAVRELLLAGRRNVQEIWMATELLDDDAVADIVELAACQPRPAHARVAREARRPRPQRGTARGDRLRRSRFPRPISPSSSRGRAGHPPFLVAIDGVTDPGNLGAIVRNCDGAGVDGVLLPRHRAVHVTPTVAKAAGGRGGARADRTRRWLPATLQMLRDHRIWMVGLDDAAERSLFDIGDLAREAICVVLGAEGAGLSRLVRERCDVLVAIPMRGRISSLNVSAAAALATYEIARHRSG